MMKSPRHRRPSQSGNIFFMLFASVALVGAFGVAASNTMKGMVASMSDVTRKTIAEEKMMSGGRLSVQAATASQTNNGDCDGDGFVEPLPFRDAGAGPHPAGGGYLPLQIGATEKDPWGTEYGYCVWDPGPTQDDAGCGGPGANRLAGAVGAQTHPVIAVISAGKDRVFSTSCHDFVDTTPADGNPDSPLIVRSSSGDDIIIEYTYNDADGLSGDDLWKIRDTKPDTAMIDKNIEVGGGAQFTGAIDLQSKGLILPSDPGDNSVTGVCTGLNDQELRINSGNSPPILEICYDNSWSPISMGENTGCGETWTGATSPEANAWNGVTYGNGLFVSVAWTGTNRAMTSPDGITWTPRTSADEAALWRSVTYGNGLFVAVAWSGTNRVMTSTDGATWTPRTAAEANNWVSVTYGNGLFVAVAASGTNRVMTSPDGTTWTPRAAAEANTWTSVTYGNGLFVAVAADGTNRVMTSPDGATWTPRAAAEANTWYGVTYGNGTYVAVARGGTNRVMTSPDGATWTPRAAAEANEWNSVIYAGGFFTAVSGNGTNRVMTSPDGATWAAKAAAEANSWQSITHGSNKLVAVSIDGTSRAMTSSCVGSGAEDDEEDVEIPEIILPDPIAQYQLDETSGTVIYDAMNGLNGTLTGAANPTSNTGKSGKAIDFDGVDDRVSFATQSKINSLTAMTIAGWMRQDAGGAVQYIYNTRDAGSNGFYVSAGVAAGQIAFNAGTGGAWSANAAFNAGVWTHFAVTYNAAEYATAPVLYINGATRAWTSSAAASAYNAPAGGSWIGSTAGGANYFNGALDDIRIFNRVLNPAQIELLYLNRQAGVSIAPNAAAILGANKYRGTVSAGDQAACMIRPDGSIACWGADAAGMLGNGVTAVDQASPSRVETLTTANNFVQISAGKIHACGIEAGGTGFCWGNDGDGQIGNGATAGQQDTPSPISGSHVWTQISASSTHTCGLRNDGLIYCWGSDTYGQLGNGGGAGTNAPGAISDTGPWVYVATGEFSSCGIKTDGSAWCWGRTLNGKLGEGTAADSSVQSPKPVSQAGVWTKITPGETHTCGIKLDGTAWCWGAASFGKLGNGQTSGNFATPQLVQDYGPWIDIETRFGRATCGIKMDGTAWCWGDDANLELGNGTTLTANQSIPSMVVDPGPWATITTGTGFACGMKVDGSAWCWGDDTSGRLGNGTTLTADQASPTRVLYVPDDPAFAMNSDQTLLTKNAAASTISLGTAGRIGYDGTSGFMFNAAGNGIMSGITSGAGLKVETLGAYDSQISLKNSLTAYSIGVDNVTGNLEFGLNNAAATNLMSAITPQMAISPDGYLGIATTGAPVAKLDIATGGLKVGDDTRACTISRRGVLRYNTGAMQYCNGSAWTDF